MSSAAQSPFVGVPFDQRAAAVFPWPIMSGYRDIHRWMSEGKAVEAAWQVRDVWEAFIKFLGTVAMADCLIGAEAGRNRVLGELLKKWLTMGGWTHLMQLALSETEPTGTRVPGLRELLFPRAQSPLFQLFEGKDEAKNFLEWRNRRFGHGVFAGRVTAFAQEARLWLDHLHTAFDLCRNLLPTWSLESDTPEDKPLAWGAESPLPYYHSHSPGAGEPSLLNVRLRAQGAAAALELSPLMSVQRCSICGQWAAFYFDGYESRPRRAWFLDFVTGHRRFQRDVSVLLEWNAIAQSERSSPGQTLDAEPSSREEPDPDRFADFNDRFQAPTYLANAMAKFIRRREPLGGVVVLTGPGGFGKSWFCEGLGRPDMIQAPTSLGRAVPLLQAFFRMGGQGQGQAREALKELSQRAQAKKWALPAGPSPDSWEGFTEWLAKLMLRNELGELIVALDGLDELSADSDAANLLPPADRLPAGCYLVLTTRPVVRDAAATALTRVRSAPPAAILELAVGPESPAHREILRAYVKRQLGQRRRGDQPGALPAAWVDPIIDLAGGSFLFVVHYCRALHFSIWEDPTHLPSPEEYYEKFFEQVKARVGDKFFENTYARTLALIAAFGKEGEDYKAEPITLTQLTSLGLERGRLVFVLDDLADLLRSHRGPNYPETAYSLAHQTIIEFLKADPTWRQRVSQASTFLGRLAYDWFSTDWFAVDVKDHPFDRNLFAKMFSRVDGGDDDELRKKVMSDVKLAHAYWQHGRTLYGTWAGIAERDFFCVAGLPLIRLFQTARHLEPDRYAPNPFLLPGETFGPRDLSQPGWPKLSKEINMREVIRGDITLAFEPDQAEMRRLLALWYMVEAVLARRDKQYDQAMGAFQSAVAILEPLLKDLEAAENARNQAITSPEHEGENRSGRGQRVPLVGAVVRVLRFWFGRAPTSPQPWQGWGWGVPIRKDRLVKTASDLVEAYHGLAQSMTDANRAPMAVGPLGSAIDVLKRFLARYESGQYGLGGVGDDMLPSLRGRLTRAYLERAKAFRAANQPAEAMQALRDLTGQFAEAMQALRNLPGQFPGEIGQHFRDLVDSMGKAADPTPAVDLLLHLLPTLFRGIVGALQEALQEPRKGA